MENTMRFTVSALLVLAMGCQPAAKRLLPTVEVSEARVEVGAAAVVTVRRAEALEQVVSGTLVATGFEAATVTLPAGETEASVLLNAVDAKPGEVPLTFSGEGVEPATSRLLVFARGDSSIRRIGDALLAGRIDLATSLRYRGYALFRAPQLPAEFRGAPSEDWAFSLEVEEAIEAGQVSTEEAEALRAFLLPVDDPNSFYAKTFNAPDPNALMDGEVCDVKTGARWLYEAVEPSGTWVAIRVCTRSRAQADAIIAIVKAAWARVDPVFARKPPLGVLPINGKPTPVPVFINVLSGLDDGAAFVVAPSDPAAKPGSSAMLMLPIEMMRTPIAMELAVHEIFHAFQFAHTRENLSTWWSVEASAAWAGVVLGETTVSYTHLDHARHHFETPDRSLHEVKQKKKPDGGLAPGPEVYGSYLLPLYHSNEKGLEAGRSAARALFEFARGAQSVEARNQKASEVYGYRDSLRGFSVVVLNTVLEPVLKAEKLFTKDRRFPGGLEPLAFETEVELGKKTLLRESLPGVSSRYFKVKVPDGQLTIDTREVLPDFRLTALFKVADQWVELDVSKPDIHRVDLSANTPFSLIFTNTSPRLEEQLAEVTLESVQYEWKVDLRAVRHWRNTFDTGGWEEGDEVFEANFLSDIDSGGQHTLSGTGGRVTYREARGGTNERGRYTDQVCEQVGVNPATYLVGGLSLVHNAIVGEFYNFGANMILRDETVPCRDGASPPTMYEGPTYRLFNIATTDNPPFPCAGLREYYAGAKGIPLPEARSLEEIKRITGSIVCGPDTDGGKYQYILTWTMERAR
jgi:hypothetical protein